MMRLVHLNPIEPGTISGRATAGYDCVIDIVYRNAADQTWRSDLAATLVLTARTTTRNTSYLVPATDMINGKARVTIPGGDLSDPNGYAMTLVGTVDGVRKVIAKGVLALTEDGIPNLEVVDTIDRVPLLLTRGQAADLVVNLWQDAGKAAEYDIGASTVSSATQASQGGTVLVPFTVAVVDNNTVHLSLASDQVDALPDSCWWTLVVSSGTGSTTLAEGPVTVTG
jgi:hypothetical protein